MVDSATRLLVQNTGPRRRQHPDPAGDTVHSWSLGDAEKCMDLVLGPASAFTSRFLGLRRLFTSPLIARDINCLRPSAQERKAGTSRQLTSLNFYMKSKAL